MFVLTHLRVPHTFHIICVDFSVTISCYGEIRGAYKVCDVGCCRTCTFCTRCTFYKQSERNEVMLCFATIPKDVFSSLHLPWARNHNPVKWSRLTSTKRFSPKSSITQPRVVTAATLLMSVNAWIIFENNTTISPVAKQISAVLSFRTRICVIFGVVWIFPVFFTINTVYKTRSPSKLQPRLFSAFCVSKKISATSTDAFASE